jgi:glycosyltransferase involved in cell wall biosynthesis
MNNKFVFVAPMYNASQYLNQMLVSITGQSYENWKILLIDDVSTQKEKENSEKIIVRYQNLLSDMGKDPQRIKVTWNENKKWEVANVLHGISLCDDEDIICRIDADDWLTEIDALACLNSLYQQTGADALWTAHRWGFTDKNISGPMTPNSDPYKHPWVSSHLKTFRKRLINEVPYENFTNESGELVKRAGDQAVFLPVLYKTQKRGYVPRVMYHYTINDVPETYQTDDARFQRDEAVFLRSRGYVSKGDPWESVIR